ncbi:MAG: enoyl-[acyl-carrier-protein] reductase FabL [Deltaproteobacteria bacterium]|jgi:enoyl-[acyl-carrier protein] reductase III|nr:MAG: enoyl-[acyl-carrier-protein] reductase FabL [Deltaproteobacteria bacterium]
MLDLQGKVALVTGSSRGIGKAIALSLAENGANLVVNYFRHRQEAENTAKSIRSKGVRCLTVKANVADDEDIKNIFEQVKNEYGRLDVLISNAASGVLKPALELTEKHWQWTMNINARALLSLAQHAIPLMQNGGRIIAVSSLGAVRAIENYAAVGASKAALESLVRHLAVELAPRGINANVVSAGAVDTEALKHFPTREIILEKTLQRTPAGRLTTPEDVANVVLLLCSDLASMIHGQTIVVDGGYSILA